MLLLIIMAAVVVASIVWAIVATLARTATDGYGRIPTRVGNDADGRARYRRIW